MKTICRVEECQYAARDIGYAMIQLHADFAKLYNSKLNAGVIFKVQKLV